MANPFDCAPEFEDVEIVSATFTVNGESGVVDIDRALDQEFNCPVIDSVVAVTPVITGGQSPTVTYKFYIDGEPSVLQEGSSNQFTIPRDLDVFNSTLMCELIANDVGGGSSDTFLLNMGWIHGISPSISNTLQSFVSTDSGEIVQPGQTIQVTYTEGSNFDLGYPVSSIESTINIIANRIGNPFTYTVASDGDEPNCKISVNNIKVDNSSDIPRTQSITNLYSGDDSVIASVQNPVDGAPCGEAIGACCKGGIFDPETGITTGSCTIETFDDCTNVIGGEYKGNGTICESFPGSPCFEEIGLGRCCCVTETNQGACESSVTFEYCMNGDFKINNNCDVLHPSTDPTGVTWSHNQSCPSLPCGVPCCNPEVGKCCEIIGDEVTIPGVEPGPTCAIGLESIDCPRYDGGIAGVSFEFQGTGTPECGNCKDINYNFSYTGQNEYCCEPLGRCCSNGAPVEGDDSVYYYESECDDLSGVWAEGQLYPDCSTNPGLPCCPQLGRCCWKVGDQANCRSFVTQSFCDAQPGDYGITKQWSAGSNTCPGDEDGNCSLDESGAQNSEGNLCCDTVLGRCCGKIGTVATCDQNVPFSSCSAAFQEWDFTNSPCPDCAALTLIERNDEQCCSSPTGRCCWKNGNDGNCLENQTLNQCSISASKSIQAIIDDGNFVENGVCTANNDGSGCTPSESENDLCCDTVIFACCDEGTCFGPKSFSECEALGGKQVIGLDECPTCETDCPGLGCDECCGDASLSITGFLVDGQPYDTDLNPIGRGKTVSVQISESLISGVTYQFEFDDQGVSRIIEGAGSSPNLVIPSDSPLFLSIAEGPDVSAPGKILESRVFGTSVVDGSLLETSQQLAPINGDPPVLPTDPNSLNEVYYGAGIGFPTPVPPPGGVNENTVLNIGDFVNIFTSGLTTAGADPPAQVTTEYVDENGDFLSSEPYYIINGSEPGCGVNLKVRFDNRNVGGIDIPGGDDVEQTYNFGQVVTPEGSGVCAVDGDEGRCCCGGAIDPITGITAGSCDEMVTEFDCNQRVVNGECVEVSWENKFYQNGSETFCPTCDERNSVSYPCCPVYPTGRCCRTGFSCQDNVFEIDCAGVWDKDKVCPITPCESSDTEEQRCGCDPSVTGACCCPFEGCIENVNESDCNGQYCTDNLKPSLYYAPGNPSFPNSDLKSPVWLGPNTTCPESDTLDCNFMCCELGDKDLDVNGNLANDGNDVIAQSCVGKATFPNVTECRNSDPSSSFSNPCTGLATNQTRKRCYAPVLPNGENLVLTTPCDYRYTTKFESAGSDYEFCALNGLCSCYRETPPNEFNVTRRGCVPEDYRSTLNYSNDTKESLVGNPIYMCERVINDYDPFCAQPDLDLDGGWDADCAEPARLFCTLKKANSGNLIGDNLLVKYCDVLKNSSLSYEQDWYSANCDTISENHTSYPPLVALNDEYVSVYKQEYYPCGQNTGSPTQDNSAEAIDMNNLSEVYSDGKGLPCVDDSMLSGLSWQECRLLLNGCSIPGQGCSTIQECLANCTINIGDGPLQQGG